MFHDPDCVQEMRSPEVISTSLTSQKSIWVLEEPLAEANNAGTQLWESTARPKSISQKEAFCARYVSSACSGAPSIKMLWEFTSCQSVRPLCCSSRLSLVSLVSIWSHCQLAAHPSLSLSFCLEAQNYKTKVGRASPISPTLCPMLSMLSMFHISPHRIWPQPVPVPSNWPQQLQGRPDVPQKPGR